MKTAFSLSAILLVVAFFTGCRGVQVSEPLGEVVIPEKAEEFAGWWRALSADENSDDTLFYVRPASDKKSFLIFKSEWNDAKQSIVTEKSFSAVFTKSDGLWANFRVYEGGTTVKPGWYFAKVERMPRDETTILLFPSAKAFERLVDAGKLAGTVTKNEVQISDPAAKVATLLASETGKTLYGREQPDAPVLIMRRVAK